MTSVPCAQVGKDTAKDLFILSGTSVMTGSGKLLSVAVRGSVQRALFDF